MRETPNKERLAGGSSLVFMKRIGLAQLGMTVNSDSDRRSLLSLGSTPLHWLYFNLPLPNLKDKTQSS